MLYSHLFIYSSSHGISNYSIKVSRVSDKEASFRIHDRSGIEEVLLQQFARFSGKDWLSSANLGHNIGKYFRPFSRNE